MKKQGKPGWDSISGALPECSGETTQDSSNWYAIQTRYRFEQKVTAELQARGWDAFLPLLKEIHRWSDRRQQVNIPLFPGYTFAQFNRADLLRREFLKTSGIIGLIEFAGAAVPIPGKQVDDLRQLLSQKVPCALHPFLKAGQKVRIRDGSLDGLEGILKEAGEKSLVISIEAIQRAIAVHIEGYELQLI